MLGRVLSGQMPIEIDRSGPRLLAHVALDPSGFGCWIRNVSGNRGRRPYPPEFRREAVELYRRSANSLAVVAGVLGVTVESLRSWNQSGTPSMSASRPA